MDTAVLFLLALTFILLALNLFKSCSVKRKPTALISEGRIDETALKKTGVTIEKIISEARLSGYFNIGDIDTAILEENGRISFLLKSGNRPLNPNDFNFSPVREGVPEIIVKNGKIIEENLKKTQANKADIMNVILSRGRKLENILLATVSDSGRVDVFERSRLTKR